MVVALLYASRHLKKAKAQNSFTCNPTLNWRGESASNIPSPSPRNSSATSTPKRQNSVKSEDRDDYEPFNFYVSAAFYSLIGLLVEVQNTDGETWEGILESVAPSAEFHLVGARLKEGSGLESGSTFVYNKVFAFKDIVCCQAKEVDVEFAKREELLIDRDISSGTLRKDRDLVQWQPEEDTADVEESDLEDTDRRSGWDFNEMIRIHEQKHGAYSTFEHTMSSYMSSYDGIDDDIRSALADKAAREIQLETKSNLRLSEDLISEEESKSDDDLKSVESSKSEYPKSSEDDLKSEEELKSEDELKSENGADDEGHEDSGIGEEDVFSSISSTPPPTPTDQNSKHSYPKHKAFYNHHNTSSGSKSAGSSVESSDSGNGNSRNPSAVSVEEIASASSTPQPKPKEVTLDVPSTPSTDAVAATGDDGFTVSRSRSRRRSRRKKKQQEQQQEQPQQQQNQQGQQKQQPQQQQRPQRQQQQQPQQQQQQPKQQKQQQQKQTKQQQQQHQQQQQQQQQLQQQQEQLKQLQQQQEQQFIQEQLQQQQQSASSASCAYRNVLSYSAVAMRRSEERVPTNSFTTSASCRRSSTSSTSSTSSSLQTQISSEDYPIPQTLTKKSKPRHKSKQKNKTPKDSSPIMPHLPTSIPHSSTDKVDELNKLDSHCTVSVEAPYECPSNVTVATSVPADNLQKCENSVEQLRVYDEPKCIESNDELLSVAADSCISSECTEELLPEPALENELEQCPPDNWEDKLEESEFKFLDNDSITQTIIPEQAMSPALEDTPGELKFFDSSSSIEQCDTESAGSIEASPTVEDIPESSDLLQTSPIEQMAVDEISVNTAPMQEDITGSMINAPGIDNCCYLVLSSAATDPSVSLITSDSCSVLDVHGSVNQPPTLNESDVLVKSTLNPTASEFTLNPTAKEFIYEKKTTFTDGDIQVQQQEFCYSQTYVPYVGLPADFNASSGTTPTSTTTTSASTSTVIQHHEIPYKQFYTWSYVASGHGFYYGIPTPLELFSANGSYYFAAAQPQVNEQMQQILQANGLPIPTDVSNYTHARQFYVMHQSVQYTPSQQQCIAAMGQLEGPATEGVVEKLLEEPTILNFNRDVRPKNEDALPTSQASATPQEEFKEGDPALYQTAFPPLTESD